MNSAITSRPAFTALIVAFLFHNVEEAISICSYPVQSPLSFIKPATCHQFLWAVSILTLIVIVLFIAAMRTNKAVNYLFISTSIASALLINVIVPHVFVAIYTFHYTPGLVSAILLNLPLSIATLVKNRLTYSQRKQFFKHIITGLVLGYLLFAFMMQLVMHFA